MSARSGTLPLARLRAAAGARVEAIGLRPAAREIGMSAPGLRSLLEGTEPHPATYRKLERWYLATAVARHEEMDLALVQLTFSLLLSDLSAERRGAAIHEVASSFQRIFEAERVPSPTWLHGLLRGDPPGGAEGSGQ